MTIFHTCISTHVIDYLSLPDFDKLRATVPAVKQLLSRFERQLLRRTVRRLCACGQGTHIVLQDVLQQNHWTYVINVAGWLDDGLIGTSLNILQERLTELRDLWGSSLTQTKNIEITEAD